MLFYEIMDIFSLISSPIRQRKYFLWINQHPGELLFYAILLLATVYSSQYDTVPHALLPAGSCRRNQAAAGFKGSVSIGLRFV